MEVGQHCAHNLEVESGIDEDIGLAALGSNARTRFIGLRSRPSQRRARTGHPATLRHDLPVRKIPGAPLNAVFAEWETLSRYVLQRPNRCCSNGNNPPSHIPGLLDLLCRFFRDLEPLFVQLVL